MKKHLNLRNLFLVLLLLLVSCTPKAQLIGVWADESFSDYKINDVLVIGISRDANAQKLWEDVFTSHLNQEKVNAMASYVTVGGTIKPERESVEAAIRKSGAKTVLISRVIDATTESQSTLGRRASSLATRHHSAAFSGRLPRVWLSFIMHSTRQPRAIANARRSSARAASGSKAAVAKGAGLGFQE